MESSNFTGIISQHVDTKVVLEKVWLIKKLNLPVAHLVKDFFVGNCCDFVLACIEEKYKVNSIQRWSGETHIEHFLSSVCCLLPPDVPLAVRTNNKIFVFGNDYNPPIFLDIRGSMPTLTDSGVLPPNPITNVMLHGIESVTLSARTLYLRCLVATAKHLQVELILDRNLKPKRAGNRRTPFEVLMITAKFCSLMLLGVGFHWSVDTRRLTRVRKIIDKVVTPILTDPNFKKQSLVRVKGEGGKLQELKIAERSINDRWERLSIPGFQVDDQEKRDEAVEKFRTQTDGEMNTIMAARRRLLCRISMSKEYLGIPFQLFKTLDAFLKPLKIKPGMHDRINRVKTRVHKILKHKKEGYLEKILNLKPETMDKYTHVTIRRHEADEIKVKKYEFCKNLYEAGIPFVPTNPSVKNEKDEIAAIANNYLFMDFARRLNLLNRHESNHWITTGMMFDDAFKNNKIRNRLGDVELSKRFRLMVIKVRDMILRGNDKIIKDS
jgi:hypothetical protein